MKKVSMIVGVLALSAFSADAAEWSVDRTRPDDSGNGKSVEAAKRIIQAAVSAVSAGDVVTVLPGRVRTTRAAHILAPSSETTARC